MSESTSNELVYVSWGGTGRAASLRSAMATAASAGSGLVYLAIIDQDTFADLDDSMVDLVQDELEWLLDAQIELSKEQIGAQDLAVRVLVRRGDVDAHVITVVETLGETSVLIGAPAASAGHESVEAMVQSLRQRTGRPVDLVQPD